jgi:hypothetical protein
MKFIIQLLEIYNDAAQRFQDWAFKYVVPPTLKIIEIGLRLTMLYAFYLLVVNALNEIF